MPKISIKEELKRRDWRIANLARNAGVSYPTAMEATHEGWPTKRVTWGTITAIARALGVDPKDLLTNNGTE